MQDPPNAEELLETVHDFLMNVAVKNLSGHDAFHARVAANSVDIVRRSLEQSPNSDQQELDRLRELLDMDGDLTELNRELGRRIRNGEIALESDVLKHHLRENTLAKLAIDQPKYASYRDEIGSDPKK